MYHTTEFGCSLQVGHGFLVIDFDHPNSNLTSVSGVVRMSRQFLSIDDTLEVIVDLKSVNKFNKSVLKLIWQLTRLLQEQGKVVKCVQPAGEIEACLALLSQGGYMELYCSMEEVIDSLDGDECEGLRSLVSESFSG